MSAANITDQEFSQFQKWIHQIAGIHMSPAKKLLVSGRLGRRLRHHQLDSYGEYFRLLASGKDRAELQMAVDLLTTNETYFFRESKHFDFLRDQILPGRQPGQPFRVWSAASSTGEEAYSIAMTLADSLGGEAWEVLGSDISTRVLEKARAGHYSLERVHHLPRQFMVDYCLKGVGAQAGTFLVDPKLRQRVRFMQVNLNGELPRLGEFDVIFLRNVMIYFDGETKRRAVSRLVSRLRPGGYFIIGHSESLSGLATGLQIVMPSIYRKPR